MLSIIHSKMHRRHKISTVYFKRKNRALLPYRSACLLLFVICLCGGFPLIPSRRLLVPLVMTNRLYEGGKVEDPQSQGNHLDYLLPEGGRYRLPKGASAFNINGLVTQQFNVTEMESVTSTRRFLLGSALISAASLLSIPSDASDLPWEVSPVNKRFGVTVFDAEQMGYNVRFVTYLSRFLLNFDADCQRWWFARAADIPRNANLAKVADLRLRQFAAFSASVEVGLQEYSGSGGPERLMKALLDRYTLSDPMQFSPSEERIQKREIKEARRQIALLFGLMEIHQPVSEITKLLAAVDNATITEVILEDPGIGYALGYGPPSVTFPLPEAGDSYKTAKGRAVLRPNGRILRIDLLSHGFGYAKAPEVTISPPVASSLSSAENGKEQRYEAATAKAIIFRSGINKGKIERIQLDKAGSGYAPNEKISIEISPPELSPADGGVIAKADAILEYEVGSIIILDGGYGYAAEKAIPVIVEPPPLTARINLNDPMLAQYFLKQQPPNTPLEAAGRVQVKIEKAEKAARGMGSGGGGGCFGRACYDKKVVAFAYAVSEADSYSSFREAEVADKFQTVEAALERRSAAVVSGSSTGYDGGSKSFPFRVGEPSSSLLALIPSGIGLTFISRLNRYVLVPDQDYEGSFSEAAFSSKPLDPEFGPRGRSPIERDKDLDFLTYLRFCISGAICSGGVHLLLTPLDVVKTKLQTNPKKYPNTLIAFKTVWSEGPSTFFTGWQPTFLGFFALGSISYSTTEVFRRFLIDLANVNAMNLEVPIIVVSAALASAIGSCVIVPFETVRIRYVSQPNFAENILGVAKRIVREEGVPSLFSALPVFLAKEIPFACAKFTVFDLSTQYMYQLFPVAQEDIQLSLFVSLAGGALGGIAAAVVSNPADATVSEMKKAKTSLGPWQAANALFVRGGIPALFGGLPLRMFFYSLMISLQFVVYDSVRYALGIGSDDLKLYLDVLGGALRERGGPI